MHFLHFYGLQSYIFKMPPNRQRGKPPKLPPRHRKGKGPRDSSRRNKPKGAEPPYEGRLTVDTDGRLRRTKEEGPKDLGRLLDTPRRPPQGPSPEFKGKLFRQLQGPKKRGGFLSSILDSLRSWFGRK